MILDASGRPLKRTIGYIRDWVPEVNDYGRFGETEPVDLVSGTWQKEGEIEFEQALLPDIRDIREIGGTQQDNVRAGGCVRAKPAGPGSARRAA